MMGVMGGPGGQGGYMYAYGQTEEAGPQPLFPAAPQPVYSPPMLPAPQGANTFELIPHRVFVGGFPPATQDQELRAFFEAFGNVKEVKLIKNPDGVPKGYGFVTFNSEAEATATRNLQAEQLEFRGRKLNIGPAMRRINLSTRFSDLAYVQPTAAPPGPFLLGACPPYPGYSATVPLNSIVPQHVPAMPHAPFPHHLPAQHHAHWPAPQLTVQAPTPPQIQHPYYQTFDRRHHRPSPPFHRKPFSRFDDAKIAARKAGGGGNALGHPPQPNNTTPHREPTPLPPLGHPLTPLTPNYHANNNPAITPPPTSADQILYASPSHVTSLNSVYTHVANEIPCNGDAPNYIG